MSQGNLTGRKVLVVEDDYLQAKAIAQALTEHGAEVVGPFARPEECLAYCQRNLIHAAVLDVMVRNADSFPVADRLVREEIPFIFLTGYDRKNIPHRFRRVPHYLKPFVGTDGAGGGGAGLGKRAKAAQKNYRAVDVAKHKFTTAAGEDDERKRLPPAGRGRAEQAHSCEKVAETG